MARLLAILFCLTSFQAHAERIRDMSLSPEESMRQPDIIDSGANQKYLQPFGGGIGGVGGAGSNYNANQRGGYHAGQLPQKKFFMEEYCHPTIQPIIKPGAFGGLMGCMEGIKKQACDGFSRLPNEAKTLVDNTVRCVYQATQSGSGGSIDVQCRQPYAEQMWLLKKYWSEASTAYTIVFLPDMLVDAGSFCQNGSR